MWGERFSVFPWYWPECPALAHVWPRCQGPHRSRSPGHSSPPLWEEDLFHPLSPRNAPTTWLNLKYYYKNDLNSSVIKIKLYITCIYNNVQNPKDYLSKWGSYIYFHKYHHEDSKCLNQEGSQSKFNHLTRGLFSRAGAC